MSSYYSKPLTTNNVNMKRFVSLVLMFSSLIAMAQIKESDVVIEKGMDSFSYVFTNTNAAKLNHSNAKQWVAKTFGDYKSVLQYEDDENYKIIIKGQSKLPLEDNSSVSATSVTMDISGYNLTYTITIDSKDERFRAKMEDIQVIRDHRTSHTNEKSTLSLDEYLAQSGSLDSGYTKMANEVEELEGMDTSKMKKKELNEHQRKLRVAKEVLSMIEKRQASNQKREPAVKDVIYTLFASLEKAAAVNDDF